MAEAIVSIVLEQLAEIVKKQIQEEVSLVRGVKKEILYLSDELKTIQNVLDDAERRGYKEKTIQHWLNKLEDTSYDIADVLDEWNYAILKLQIEGPDNVVMPKPKVCPFIPSPCLCFEKVTFRRDIAKKIKGVKERMDMIVKEKARYDFIVAQPVEPKKSDRVKTTSFVEVAEIQGRREDKDAVVSRLLEGADQEERNPRVISIVGTGGIGKTTLAQLVYNDDGVTNCFKKKIWVCVSDVSDEVKIAKGIVEQVNGSAPNLNELESLLKCLEDSISGEKFLLVLDDVWTEYCTKWEPLKKSLKRGGLGSKILITTRSERVAKLMGTTENEIHRLGQLSHEDCWLLMRGIAFFERTEEDCEKLKDIGWDIANKCKGLPLAAKVLGSLLRFKDDVQEWEHVLDSEIWQLKEAEVELFPHLFLSYNELSPAMKRCFSYCAIFPKDFQIDVEKLIRMWMALGYLSSGGSSGDLELRGREYFDNLIMRSFFQEFCKHFDGSTSCKMHDIVHDFAQFLRKNKSHDNNMAGLYGRDGTMTNELFQSQIKVYRSLICEDILPFTHLSKSLSVLRVLECGLVEREIENLTRLRYLQLKHCPRLDHIPQSIFKLYNLETLYLNDLGLKEIPEEIGNLINLRHLDLSHNYNLEKLPETIYNLHNLETLYLKFLGLEEIPEEIGNLINLRHLDLSRNSKLRKLPETIYNLHYLRTLNLGLCDDLQDLHEGIERLVNLKQFINKNTAIERLPSGLEQLTSLQTLNKLITGRGCSKLGYLNKLDKLSGEIKLFISLDDAEDVIEARKAKLRKKIHIKELHLTFLDQIKDITDEEKESIRNDVIEALQPPPNLTRLEIVSYQGIKFVGWIASSLDNLRVLGIHWCNHWSTLPPLGKLPRLEELRVSGMGKLEILGREFLGIASLSDDINTSSSSSSSSSSMVIGFPKLKELNMSWCNNLKEWEDITDEEEERATVSIMPCLETLVIQRCNQLRVLPLRLLRKASSLRYLEMGDCEHLYERYKDKEGSDWRLLSRIPQVELSHKWN